MSLTKEQLKVVETKNKNLLVSASAGSGKTHTMIERIFHLIKEEKLSIKQLLILTFTNAAASEMKQKIVERILQEAENNEHLKMQLEDAAFADISTMHMFCSKLVKQYFYEASIDPVSKIMEEDESLVLKNDALTKTLQNYIEKNDAVFDLLFETYNKKRRDQELRQSILKLYNFLKTKHDYKAFIKEALNNNYNINLSTNTSAIYINNYFLEIISHYTKQFKKLKLQAEQLSSKSLVLVVENVLNTLQVFALNNTYEQSLRALNNLERFMQMPRKVEALEEDLKQEIGLVKTSLVKSLDEVKDYFALDVNEVKTALKNAKPLLEKLLELVCVFDKEFEALKKEKALLDFNDLEHYTLKILQNDEIRKSVQDRYEYVFIDEYQDTNHLQEEILKKLVKENNAFMVGDVKQSIYMFRECDPQIFVKKYNSFETDTNSVKIDLNQNFRSERGVLEFANFVFSNIMRENTASVNYQKNASFIAGANYEKSRHTMPLVGVSVIDKEDLKEQSEEQEIDSEPKIYSVIEHINQLKKEGSKELNAVALEARVIANKIYEYLEHPIYDIKQKKYREVNFNDIAILTRVKKGFIKQLCKELEKYSLPINTKYSEDVFNTTEGQLLHSYLKLINNAEDDLALFTVLSSTICNLTYNQLSEIRIHSQKAPRFYDAVMDYIKANDNAVTTKINKLFNDLNLFKQKQIHLSLQKLAQAVLEKYELINYFYSLPNGEEKVENINLILANMQKEEFENNLFTYLNYLENYLEEEFEINSLSSENSITVTTIHASKGLEYPIVIVAGMGREFNSKPKLDEIVTNKELGFGVRHYNLQDRTRKNTLVRNACLLKNKEEELAEEMRLLYVAMTRAKNHLWLVGKVNLEKVETLNSTHSIRLAKSYMHWVLGSLDEAHLSSLKQNKTDLNVPLIDGTNCKFEVVNLSEVQNEQIKENSLIFNKPNLQTLENFKKVFEFEYENKESIHILTKSSVSEIMLKEEDEKESYAIKTLRVDELNSKKDELDFSLIGSVHHLIMQHLPFNLKTVDEVKTEIKKLINMGFLPNNTYELINLETIILALKQMYELTKDSVNIKKEEQFMMYVPYNEIFANSTVKDRILVQGVIDLIVEKENEIIILDYKTSRMNKENLKQKYATQIRLYEIAYEKAYQKKVTKKLIYSFHLNNTVNV